MRDGTRATLTMVVWEYRLFRTLRVYQLLKDIRTHTSMSSQVQNSIVIGHSFELHSSSSSLADSTPSETNSSLSFAWGPGALAGMFLKWLGETAIDAVASVKVRKRLGVIKQTVRERPHIFQEASISAESGDVRLIREDLRDCCR